MGILEVLVVICAMMGMVILGAVALQLTFIITMIALACIFNIHRD